MNGYRSIYDSYQLANSNAIPLYQGSATPEALQVGQYEQGLYDTAQSGAFNVGANVDNVQSLDKDNALASELQQKVQAKLGEFSKRGDYENMLPAVQQLSSEFYNRAKELAAPMQQYQEWNKQLDSKDYNLSPEQKNALRGMAMADYGGLKKDASGRYVGGFNGRDIAANVDTVKWTNDTLKDIAIQKGGSEGYMDTNGDFIIKKGSKYEVLKADTIRGVLRNAAAMDVGLQAHISQMGDIAGYMASKMDPSKLSDIGRAAVKKYTDNGYSTSQAMQLAFGKSMQEDNIMNSILNYGVGKYQQNNQWSTMDLSTNAYHLQEAGKIKEGEDRFQVQGPDSNPLPDETDYNKVSANIKDWSTQTAVLDKQIGNIDTKLNALPKTAENSDIRTQLETTKAGLQEQLGGLGLSLKRAGDMMTYAKNQTAKNMGYTGGYEEFKNAAANKVKSSINDLLKGRKVVTSSGTALDANDISEAIVDGRATPSKMSIPGSGVMGTSATSFNTGLDITTKDGKRIHISSKTMGDKLADKMETLMSQKENKISDFQNNLSTNYANNIKNHAVSSNYIGLTKPEREELTTTLSGAKGGIKFTLPGDYTNDRPEKEVRDDIAKFEVLDVSGNAPDGVSTVSVQGYDKDGKATQLYEAHLTNSTVNSIIARKLAQANTKGNSPEAARTAEGMMPGSGASILKTLPDGNKIELGEATIGNRNVGKVKVEHSNGYYVLTDSTGTVLSDSAGKPFRTKDRGDAGSWIDFFKHQ